MLNKAHIPQEEVFLYGSDDADPLVETVATPDERARLRHDILEKDIDLLRARLDLIRARVGVVTRSSVRWANSSARSQLGAYPWAKFAALTASSCLMTMALRRLPLGSLAAMAVPIVTAAISRKTR
ncbi:hypothetical protein [Pararhizobium sp. O133]|uniref:hypothetical protein n=1 Tax=Pararhizobium sp. O133 TaxID=3449278 RepID=UPI003F685C64